MNEKINEKIEIAVNGKNESIWRKVSDHFKGKEIDILEIGVFTAGQIGQAYSSCNVKSYVGIDPYLGDSSDPYKGSYWRDEVEAFKIYEQSKQRFENLGGNLLKTTSEIYFRSIEKERRFDVIFIDGNHRFLSALRDMIYWFSCLAVGGVMIIDDYANPDTPDVTRAVNLFLEMQGGIASVDESVRWFKNKGKHIPVCSKVIYVFKAYEKIVNIDSNITKRYIWGTGKVAAEFLERCGAKIKFDGVLDNYRTGMGKWNELPFCEVNQISKENSIIVIATNLYYYDEIKEQLIEWGFQEGVNFIRYSLYEVYYVNSWYE